MSRKPSEGSTKFNPQGNYTWDADQQFTVYGKEIDIWNRTFNIMARDPQFEKFIFLQESLKLMQGFFQEAVEEGIIKEILPPSPSVAPVTASDPKNLSTLTSEKISVGGESEPITDSPQVSNG